MANETVPLSCCSSSSSEPEGSIRTASILLVDDDPTCLSIVAATLKKFKYEVVTAKHPKDALCTLRIKRESLNLVVTDVYMPDMNGFELQKTIKQEFNLPVVLMSADKGLENEVSSFFMSKPIRPDDVRNLWQFAAKKGSDDRVLKEEIGNDLPKEMSRTISVEKTISSKKERKAKDLKRKGSRKEGSHEENGANSQSSSTKKAKVVWTNALHNRFLEAIRTIGLERSVPKKILEFMNVPGLTRENVASHLQKYRIFLRRISDASYRMQYSEEEGLSRSCNWPGLTSSSFLNPGRSFRNIQHQKPGQYFLGPSTNSNSSPAAHSALLGQSQSISWLNADLIESNIRNEGLMIHQNNDRLEQTNGMTASLLQRPLLHNVSLEDFGSSLLGLNEMCPSIVHQEVAPQTSVGISSIISPMSSLSFAGKLNDQKSYLDCTIANIQNLAETGSCRRGDCMTTLSNEALNNCVNAAVPLPNDNICLDQLLCQYLGASCPSIVASDKDDNRQLPDVVADNQNLMLPLHAASPAIAEFVDQIDHQSALTPVYNLPVFNYLIDTQQPLDQEGNQVNVQNQAQHDGVKTITSTNFYGGMNNWDNRVLSLDQTAFNQHQSQGVFTAASQFTITLPTEPTECYNNDNCDEEDKFLESLLASASSEEP